MTALFLTFVSNKWRKVLPPIAAIAVVAVFLLIPRGQADNESIIVSEQNPLAHLIEENDSLEAETNVQASTVPAIILVDVKGAVYHPGVYSLEEGDRLVDAIQAAGGYLPEADTRMLNHAQKLTDELLIYVPIEGEELADNGISIVQGSESQSAEGKVNINTADEGQLMTIPGIGPAKAEAIIQYRTEHGPFSAPESLMDVSGIGKKTFEKLEHKITIN